jgi:hypothetical protein
MAYNIVTFVALGSDVYITHRIGSMGSGLMVLADKLHETALVRQRFEPLTAEGLLMVESPRSLKLAWTPGRNGPSRFPAGPDPVLGSSPRSVEPGRLFAGLHGRHVDVADSGWDLEVFAVTDVADRRWVQLALNGAHTYMLTLGLSRRDDVPQALDAVARWLRQFGTAAVGNVA